MQTIFILIMIGIIVSIVGFVLYSLLRNKRNKNRTAPDVVDFITSNPNRTAFYFIKNNDVLVASSARQIMPLAHLVNMIIAIEYANQVTKGYIDQHQLVSFDDLKLYDIPHTDDGAHESWAKTLKHQNMNTIHQDKVRLHDVVKGMIQFGSNANTAFLLDVLDVNQINKSLHKLGLHDHEEIYYFTSSLLLPAYLNVEESLTKGKIKRKLRDMPIEDFRAYSGIIHGLLKHRQAHDLIEQTRQTNIIDIEMQKLILSRFPSATIQEYTNLINNIQNGEGFEEDCLILLHELLDQQSTERETHFSSFGVQEGSNVFSSNRIVYGTTADEKNTFVLGVCMNDLKRSEAFWVRKEVHAFILKTLTDQSFQDDVVAKLS